ncbi:beta-ketoacyl-[acyl-carrier-protein] synthase family protein [Paraburkholderia bonniea]|uniref:beta-ketoacyl-[acyl-carrier-protein] synthase family protein n=1 Tax=Paraburkholderia bonniea TaxID=2152891 RepID=UPI00129093EC|nr:beta-ketoacyl-[acyl-carrier-protein] synthase family protein [Paraburkholderia bonniea]WJF91519.1 beta-ketoacyl-[acyl-carrier-protein] synthase family protein [Paraburkholderia bonniea]WJF94838.1 beta-ketoacyl-[acyl-carrier-protein] synthase family protein [Paraburkholderia bonniea]
MRAASESIVISAFGAVTPLGGDYHSIHQALRHGRSGIRAIEKFDCSTHITQHAGVPEEGNALIRWPQARREPAEVLYARLATKRLLRYAPHLTQAYANERLGCVVGVDVPGTDIQSALELVRRMEGESSREAFMQQLVRHFRMADFFNLEPTAVLAEIYRQVPFAGFATTHVGLCSASLQTIGMGLQALRQQRLDAVIVGGISGRVNPLNLARLEALDVISTDLLLAPEQRSRPFDQRRSGFVLAEGGVLLLLEREAAVRQRGATPLLRIAGYGASLGAEHIVIPHQNSLEMTLAMRRALADAGRHARDIDYVNAHGTSTILNDRHESQAIREVFGAGTTVPVTANKSLHGHLIAAAGAMEVLNTAIALREGFIAPTINLDAQGADCDVNVVRRMTPMLTTGGRVLKNSFGMGGLAASVVLEGVR